MARLLADHRTDVPSSDQHTVKPWLDGKVPFGVPVAELSASGLPLLGGRLDSVGGREVAALIYGRRSHAIDVFLGPGDGDAAPGDRSVRGYATRHWTRGGLTWWIVSDAAAADLRALEALLAAGP